MLYSQRIFWPQYNSDAKLARLIAFLKKHRPLCDEISFFTEGDGCDWRYVPAEEVEERARFLTQAVQIVRAEGFIPVINILNTLGHSDEGGPEAPTAPWQMMVGLDGTTTRQCSCPADEQLLAYSRFKYAQYGACGAVRYWIDDDLRVHNHNPVGWGCFCDSCLADFSRTVGKPLDRPTLADALRHDRSIRQAWIARAGRVTRRLIATCTEGVHETNPSAQIGLMTGDISQMVDAGVDFPAWFGDMESITGQKPWIRPGGGFWGDGHPGALLGKVHGVANTISYLPPGVHSTYEMENYPFALGEKSAHFTGLECLLVTLATRLDGIMFDMLDLAGNDLATHEKWTSQLANWQPLWEEASHLVRGTIPQGWRPALSLKHFEQHSEERDPAHLVHFDYQKARSLQLTGLPITGFEEGALGHLLAGDAALGLSLEEMHTLLEKPLIMDGHAAARFLQAGLGDRIGISALAERTEGAFEIFTDHPLNGSAAGFRRALTMKYFGIRSVVLTPTEGTASLSTLTNYREQPLGSALTLRLQEGSAPVAIIGHAPWQYVTFPQRMAQMRRLGAAMLAPSHQPQIESLDRPVAYWHRTGEHGKNLAILFNPGFDDVTVPFADCTIRKLALATDGVTLASPTSVHLPAWSIAVLALH